jgi:hypothetical protein
MSVVIYLMRNIAMPRLHIGQMCAADAFDQANDGDRCAIMRVIEAEPLAADYVGGGCDNCWSWTPTPAPTLASGDTGGMLLLSMAVRLQAG